MLRYLKMIDSIVDLFVTLISASLIILLVDVIPILAGAASLLAIFFWIPRIKREIKQNYGNSLIAYIKSVFKR